MAYKLNNILLSVYGIIPGRIKGEGIAVKGIFDLPKRIGDTHKSWGDEDSVEPYVAVNEIFLAGRNISFAGVLIGTKAEIETNITALKTAISSFTNSVQFETPYGNACVVVKKITPKIYNGGTTILIEFREHVVGFDCTAAPPPPPTVYLSAAYSETADKNDCDSGFHGSTEQLTAVAGQFTSTFSQQAADLLAIDWVRDNVQDNANLQGTCIVNPVVYWNTKQSSELTKNDCGQGFAGSVVSYVVEPFTYSSLISQADADAQALAEITANFTQAYANTNGSCSLLPSLTEVARFTSSVLDSHNKYQTAITQQFLVGPQIIAGTIYNIMIYSVKKTYTSQIGDSPSTIASALANLINTTTLTEWTVFNQFLDSFAVKPSATISTSNTSIIKTVVMYGEATGWVINI